MTKLKNHFPSHLPTTTTFFPPFSIFWVSWKMWFLKCHQSFVIKLNSSSTRTQMVLLGMKPQNYLQFPFSGNKCALCSQLFGFDGAFLTFSLFKKKSLCFSAFTRYFRDCQISSFLLRKIDVDPVLSSSCLPALPIEGFQTQYVHFTNATRSKKWQ